MHFWGFGVSGLCRGTGRLQDKEVLTRVFCSSLVHFRLCVSVSGECAAGSIHILGYVLSA